MLTITVVMALALLQAGPGVADGAGAVVPLHSEAVLLRDRSLDRIFTIIPEARMSEGRATSFLAGSMLQWSDRLTSPRQMDVAMLVLLSYGLPERASTRHGADPALALAFLAAEIAAGGAATDSRQDHVLDTGTSGVLLKPAGPDRRRRAQRALAWGQRLGICQAAFVTTLRELPGPEMRRVVSDLGTLAYDDRSNCGETADRN